jgi:uncharacterized DUF497 family protein
VCSAIRWVALFPTRGIRLRKNGSLLLGLSQDHRLLAVMYVDQDQAIRIVSARRPTLRERRNYEEITH